MAKKTKQTKDQEEREQQPQEEPIQNPETVEDAKESQPEEPAEQDTALAQALKEKEEYLNALIRERADFENYKKRMAMAASKGYQDGKADVILAILPVIDNLERALASVQEESPLKTGVEMVLRQVQDALKALGTEEIQAEGQEFDPAFHDAVMQVDAEEGEKSGYVKEVLMKGYKMEDRILRHSMVKVTN